jgi:segregation and condensation protein A
MTPNVIVGSFEGPLSLLLELVERNQLEIASISVADITTQYLERVRSLTSLEPTELSEFLRLGARLVYIKSANILPQGTSRTPDEELRRINLELDEYRAIRVAARALAERSNQRSWERPVGERLPLEEWPWPRLELAQLTTALNQLHESDQNTLKATPEPDLMRGRLRLSDVIHTLRGRLADGFELPTRNNIDRIELIITFLALLELIREGAARASQPQTFSPIQVEANL